MVVENFGSSEFVIPPKPLTLGICRSQVWSDLGALVEAVGLTGLKKVWNWGFRGLGVLGLGFRVQGFRVACFSGSGDGED